MDSDNSKLGINSILSISARGSELISLVFIHFMLTRYLGASDFGLYAFAISFVMVFYPIIDLGMDHIFVREINKDKSSTCEIFYSTILLKFVILLPTIIIIACGIHFISPDRNLFWGIIIEGIATLLVRQFFCIIARAFFVAFEELKYDLTLSLISQITKILILLIVVYLDMGFIAVFFVILGGDLVYGLPGTIIALSRYLSKREQSRKDVTEDLKSKINKIKKMLIETLPVGLTLILITASFHIDVFIIKHFLNDEKNGIFAAAYRIIATLISCSVPVIWVMMPLLSRSAKTNTLARELQKGMKFILLLSIPLITGLFFFAETIVSFFGEDFKESAYVLKFLVIVLIFRFIGYLFDLALIAMDKQKLTIIGSTSLFIVNLTLDFLLIKHYDIYGACIGTLAADISTCILLYILLKSNLDGFYIFKIIVKPIIAAIIFVAWMRMTGDFNLILSFSGGFLIYCLCIYFFKILNDEEIAFFKKLSGKFVIRK